MKTTLCTLFSAFLVLFSSVYVQAQVSTLVEMSDLIVEGITLEKKPKWNDSRTQIYTENKVAVKAVFKGEVTQSIITVITSGGEIDDYAQYSPHAINLHASERGYFFLQQDNEKQEWTFVDKRYGVCLANNDLNPKIFCVGKPYNQRDFENAIIEHTRFPKISIDDFLHADWSNSAGGFSPCNSSFSPSINNSIEFTFDNVEYTQNFSYVEFDIMAQVNTPGLKFGKGDIVITYTPAFGSYLINSQVVEVTKGDIIQNAVYTNSYQDASSQSILISIGSNPGTGGSSLYSFPQTPESLVHVKISLQNINQIGSISFDDISVNGNVHYWCRGVYHLFDGVSLDEPIVSVEPQTGTEVSLTYTFENATSYSGETFSIDVFSHASDSSYFSNALLYINYNNLGFGSNVHANSTVSFSAGELITNGEIYDVHITDYDNNTLQLLVTSSSTISQANLTLLSTEPKKLGTLTFTIADCEETKGLSFAPLTTDDNHTHFTGLTPIPNELYIPVIATDEEDGKICATAVPGITSISPLIIPAGNGDILTITGTGFGTFDPANSTVIFENGDDDVDEMEAGESDFKWDGTIHWAETEIKIKVPSTDKNLDAKRPAATGKIKVKNVSGTSDPSSQTLQVPYAISNVRVLQSVPPLKIALKETNSSGICFNFSSDVPDWVRTEFNKALQEWCSETGINFMVGNTINNNNVALDGKNIVSFSSNSSGGVGGQFVIDPAYFVQTCTAGQEPGRVYSELDIKILSGITNPSLEDEEKLRENIIHELGHAHMLSHSNSGSATNQYIMHPNGNIDGIITSSDSEGANKVFQNSMNIVQGACGTPISHGNCAMSCIVNSTENIPTSALTFNVFPNPTNTTANIFIDNLDSSSALLSVVDTYGKEWSSQEVAGHTISSKILLPSLPGVYFILLQTEDTIISRKIIKL